MMISRILIALVSAVLVNVSFGNVADHRPNIVLILADDAGIGDFSAYGCRYGLTPNIDRLATEGMKFTQAYSGSAVCAPSRCVLMTGLHAGHALIRANFPQNGTTESRLSLPAGQLTVARLLQEAGYATGGFGKWGLGNPGQPGVPENQGFDYFFGYYDQKHAHDYYTGHLLRNSLSVPLPQDGHRTWEHYSHTAIAGETLEFIERNKDRPFFCYAAWTPPHADYTIPDNSPYSQRLWPEIDKNYAAMIALLDRDVGRIIEKLKELRIDDQTLVIFTSDNGANRQFLPLGSTGGLRGYKRLLYEGGIRAPFIARWPGKIRPGTVSDVLTTFADFLPTAADLCGARVPQGIDGLSILPTLLGREQAVFHEFLYFEIYEPYFQQAARLGQWKGYRVATKAPLELYRLEADPNEQRNVASAYPDIVQQIEKIMAAEHTSSPYFTAPEQTGAGKIGRANEKDAVGRSLKISGGS